MKNIEIKTAQNVVLDYELATVQDRMIAFLIDLIVVVVTLVVLSFIGFGVFRWTTAFGIFLSCIFIFYSLAMETLNRGQSLGKMWLRIRVIKTNGSHASLPDYIARWIFRMIDIYFSLGGIASILIASSARAQRIGDIVANTAVIKLDSRVDMSLTDLLALHARDSYVTTYPLARQLPEEEVLLIKETLDRFRKFENTAHAEAVILLSSKIAQQLGIPEVTRDRQSFLQTVLQDYVILTR